MDRRALAAPASTRGTYWATSPRRALLAHVYSLSPLQLPLEQRPVSSRQPPKVGPPGLGAGSAKLVEEHRRWRGADLGWVDAVAAIRFLSNAAGHQRRTRARGDLVRPPRTGSTPFRRSFSSDLSEGEAQHLVPCRKQPVNDSAAYVADCSQNEDFHSYSFGSACFSLARAIQALRTAAVRTPTMMTPATTCMATSAATKPPSVEIDCELF